MRVRYTPSALGDIEALFSFIARDNPHAAARVVERIERSVSLAAAFPGVGRDTDESGVLVLPVPRTPYLIFYSINGEQLTVHQIRHGARRR
jgi:toxin ParE1/3/4